jgi:DNA-binding NtrC family response regulator
VAAFLVIDDSKPVRLALAHALRATVPGAVVDEATCAAEAFERFDHGSYDAVFLDMLLGEEGSAVPILKHVLDLQPAARVILTTGLAREHPDVVEAISQGAFGYMRKPVRADSVRDALGDIDVESGRSGRIR